MLGRRNCKRLVDCGRFVSKRLSTYSLFDMPRALFWLLTSLTLLPLWISKENNLQVRFCMLMLGLAISFQKSITPSATCQNRLKRSKADLQQEECMLAPAKQFSNLGIIVHLFNNIQF